VSGEEATYRRASTTRSRLTTRRALVCVATDEPVQELTGVAALVWRALEQPVSARELIDDLAAVLDVDAATIESDLRALLGERVVAGLAEVGGP
jgi:hypothetical protein